MLELHPEAKIALDEKADQILLTVESRQIVKEPKKPMNEDIYVDYPVDSLNIIGDMITFEVDPYQQTIDKFVREKDFEFGLSRIYYKELVKLCDSISKIKCFKKYVSWDTIEKHLFNWIIKRFRRTTEISAIEYLVNEIEPTLKERIILVPIHGLKIPDMTFGKITFRKITTKIIDQWENQMLELKNMTPEIILKVKENYKKLRRNMQGYSAATIRIIAEPAKAFELAVDEVNLTISLLRIFSSASFVPGQVSSCTILGCENLETIKLYELNENNEILNEHHEIIGNMEKDWVINKTKLGVMNMMGFNNLNTLLLTEKKTDFQKKFFQAIQIYSKSSLMKDITDNIIYKLVSLETIFLKNQSESIVQNIGERIAIFYSGPLDVRKETIKVIKEIYDIRSNFIHHGEKLENIELLKSFFDLVAEIFGQLSFSIFSFESKEEFLQHLDDVKLGG